MAVSTFIKDSVESLKETDIYSLMLFSLYKMRDIPEYSTLSELVYILDKKNLLNFLECFGGMTITIPTQNELKIIINALLLYQLVDVENKDYNKSLNSLDVKAFNKKDIEVVINYLEQFCNNSFELSFPDGSYMYSINDFYLSAATVFLAVRGFLHLPWKYRIMLTIPVIHHVNAVASHTPHTPITGIKVNGLAKHILPSTSIIPLINAKFASPTPFNIPLVT